MSISEATYLEISSNEYDDSKYVKGGNVGSTKNPITVLASTSQDKAKYEKDGLQASVVKVDGQTIVAFRGSESLPKNFGKQNYDWAQDFGFNDPYGYKKSDSQTKDAEVWIADMQKEGKLPKDMSQVTFTGHSLGGGLESHKAIA